MSKFRRKRKAAHHATPATTTSWANASQTRVLILTGMVGIRRTRAEMGRPAPVDRSAIPAERRHANDQGDAAGPRLRAQAGQRQGGAAEHPDGVDGQGPAMGAFDQDRTLVEMLAV